MNSPRRESKHSRFLKSSGIAHEQGFKVAKSATAHNMFSKTKSRDRSRRRRQLMLGSPIDSYEDATAFLQRFRAFSSHSLDVIYEGRDDHDDENRSDRLGSRRGSRLQKTRTSCSLSSMGGSSSSLALSLEDNSNPSLEDSITQNHDDGWGFFLEENDSNVDQILSLSKIFIDTRPKLS